jgi:hypothetical protein
VKPNSTAGALPRPAAWLLFDVLCAAGVNSLLLWFFHNRFWYAPDEGNYAHVAQRLLTGEVLNLQVQDIHLGYINFVNAAAFRIFGLDLLSLRYPLVFMAFTQAMLIFIMFYRSGRRRLAAVAAVSINALGVVNFLNPTSNWYGLFIVVLIVCTLVWIPRDSGLRIVIVGFLVGMLVLFRQLSGVLVCMGVVTCLLLEMQSSEQRDGSRQPIAARVLLAIMATGLGWYLARNTDGTGFLLFGFCPMLILGWLFMKTSVANGRVLRNAGELAAGGLIASLPLVLYHVAHGSVQAWLNDTIVGAVNLTKLPFMGLQLYGKLVVTGVTQFFRPRSLGELLNAVYWIALPLVAFVQGVVLLRFLSRDSNANPVTFTLPVLTVFYAIVSVHFQIPVYLYYTVGFSLVGLLWLVSVNKSRLRYVVLCAAILLSFVAVYYHAGQPLSGDLFSGRRNIAMLPNVESGIPGVSLMVDEEERRRYEAILKVIESETTPAETIFAIPTNAELYFLSGRRNPFRFYNTALGIRTPEQLEQVKQTIVQAPPKIVIHHAADKYNTAYSQEVVRLVSERYDFLGETSGFAVYRSRQNADRPTSVTLK